jgi:hypothetical protein
MEGEEEGRCGVYIYIYIRGSNRKKGGHGGDTHVITAMMLRPTNKRVIRVPATSLATPVLVRLSMTASASGTTRFNQSRSRALSVSHSIDETICMPGLDGDPD